MTDGEGQSDEIDVIEDAEFLYPDVLVDWDGSIIGSFQPFCSDGLLLDVRIDSTEWIGLTLVVQADIGAKQQVLLNQEMLFAPFLEYSISVDITPALLLDEKQFLYTTHISGAFTLLDSHGDVVPRLGQLEDLYLVLHPDGGCELLDRISLLNSHPLGITNTSEAIRVESAMAQLPAVEGEPADLVGSGARITGPYYYEDSVPVLN